MWRSSRSAVAMLWGCSESGSTDYVEEKVYSIFSPRPLSSLGLCITKILLNSNICSLSLVWYCFVYEKWDQLQTGRREQPSTLGVYAHLLIQGVHLSRYLLPRGPLA